MAWTIGANDVANAMGTSVGSGALTVRKAILVAAVLEFLGAYLVGGHVTDTVRKGMLDMEIVAQHTDLLLYGMLASLASAATLLLGATRLGLPVSTTHAIVGAIVGFGAVGLGVDAVNWGKVSQIVLSWLTSPLLSGVLGFLLFLLTRAWILDREDPLGQVRRIGPIFFFYVFFIIGLVTLFKGLKNLKLDLALPEALLGSAALGLVGALLGWIFLRRVDVTAVDASRERFSQVERVFVVLQVLTACAVAFAHGSNDVANSIGPLAAVVSVARELPLGSKAPVEPWMLALGGLGIVLGLATWGHRVMETVGKKITELTPSRGFAAELAAATTIVLASRLGIPISTTHTLVGAVLGVGLARGIGALDLRVVGNIVVSWVATLPIAAGLSVFFFYFFKGLLG
ncbi:MAG: inorganic phosphate transporter [Proteobacteria bacterium]|nr:inorganic phosphate transporter [Pseudomonadota bacterium]